MTSSTRNLNCKQGDTKIAEYPAISSSSLKVGHGYAVYRSARLNRFLVAHCATHGIVNRFGRIPRSYKAE